MADRAISAYTAITAAEIATNDLLPLVDVSAGSGGSKKMTTAVMLEWMRKYKHAISIREYGAVGDAVTDDTAAIQAALDVGGAIFIPPTPGLYFKISATLLITKPVMLFGAGSFSKIACSSAFTTTTDLIRIVPVEAVTTNYSFEDFTLVATSQCRHGVHIDLTTSTVAGLAFFQMNRVSINVNYTAGQAGRSVKLTNPTNQDGFYVSYFRGCYFLGGIKMDNCGDSVSFTENVFGYINPALDLSFTSGAAQVIIEKNNITSIGGAIILHNGIQTKIRNNQIEQAQAYSGTEAACITLKGDIAQIQACEIYGNNINTQGNVTYGIDVQGATNTNIFDNDISAATHIRVGASAVNTTISRTRNRFTNLSYAQVPMVVTNTGTGTAGPWITPTLQNGWTAYDSANFPVRYFKDETGMVTIEGAITSGTSASGTVLFTLPSGFYSTYNNFYLSIAATSAVGVLGNGYILILAFGQVQFISGNSGTIFLNASFRAA